MRRSFLHAFAISCVMAFWVGIFLLVTGHLFAGIFVGLAAMLTTVMVLRAADRAPEGRSGSLKLAGWLTGLGLGLVVFVIVIL